MFMCEGVRGTKGRRGSDAKTKAYRRVPLHRSLLKDYSSLVDRINLPRADIRPHFVVFLSRECVFIGWKLDCLPVTEAPGIESFHVKTKEMDPILWK